MKGITMIDHRGAMAVLVAAVLALLGASRLMAADTKPNILLITVDDMNCDSVGTGDHALEPVLKRSYPPAREAHPLPVQPAQSGRRRRSPQPRRPDHNRPDWGSIMANFIHIISPGDTYGSQAWE